MNNERYNQIIDEAYKNYRLKSKDVDLPENLYNNLINDLNKDAMFPIDNPSRVLSQEEFINKIKTDSEFAERWGLKIEERDLTLEKRYNKWFNNNYETGMERFFDPNELPDFDNSYYEPTPTKLITVTYKENKIEVYE